MIQRITAAITSRRKPVRTHPDRGMETLEWALLAGGFIVVIGALLLLVNGSLAAWWNGLQFSDVLP